MRRTACCWVWLMTSVWLATGSTLESFQAEDGYEVFPAFNQSRYKLPTIHLDWVQALSLCQSDGGGSLLAVINSVEEAEVIKEVVARVNGTGNGGAWMGISDIATEGTWVTVQGGLVVTSGYNQWENNEPDLGVEGNCGYVGLNGLYYDYYCSHAVPFICEKPHV